MILKSELSSKYIFEAVNSYAIPTLSYGFLVIDWTITELEIVDRETRKIITNHYKNAIINFSSYLLKSEEQFLKLTSNW